MITMRWCSDDALTLIPLMRPSRYRRACEPGDVTHHYEASLRWSGSTGGGYEGYDRHHEVECRPATTALQLSSDLTFRGDPALLNPEQLLLAAASSCQLLSFLAVAARARLDVVDYVDDAEAVMPDDPTPQRITVIILRPRISIRTGPSEERVRHLVEVAHRECFIANSLRSEVQVLPEIEWVSSEAAPTPGPPRLS
jgi:organic hydroperoxide reductase OsmC/OhrA